MPQTPKGIEYPDSSGHTRLWEHLQDLADTVDAAIGDSQDKTQSADVTIEVSGSTTGTINVTFPKPYATTPRITATTGTGSYNAAVTARSSTGCTITVRHIDAASPTTSVLVSWIAHGPLA